MSTGVTQETIEQALRQAIQPLDSLEVINESHQHAGHPGAGDDTHWRVRFVSPRCAGLTRVARHRLVYDALRSLIPLGIHALAIEADAPDER
jgi:BolA protein